WQKFATRRAWPPSANRFESNSAQINGFPTAQCLSGFPWFSGILLMLALSVPWFIMAEHRTPGFLNYYFVGEHWKRFTHPHWKSLYGSAHRQPPGTVWI